MTPKPVRVSIGMPVYNGEKYLRATLDCFRRQTFDDFEIIISDNASTDQTESICREYAARDSRIRYLRNARNIGGAANHNRVLALASGEYFKWASHDDLHATHYLEQCVDVLDRDPSIVLCHSKTEYIDSNGVRINLENRASGPIIDSCGITLNLPADDPPRNLNSPRAYQRFSDVIGKPYVCVNIFGLMRSDIVRSTPGYRQVFGSERLVLAELALKGRFHHLPEYLFSWRVHAQQTTRQAGMSRQKRMAPNIRKLPKFKFLPGYCQALWKAPLSPTERALCHLALLNQYALKLSRRWRRAGGRSARLQPAKDSISTPERNASGPYVNSEGVREARSHTGPADT